MEQRAFIKLTGESDEELWISIDAIEIVESVVGSEKGYNTCVGTANGRRYVKDTPKEIFASIHCMYEYLIWKLDREQSKALQKEEN